ncbi:MAG: hypothetical protein SCH71_16550 [Desulfobulbaceae bacterium]|nr:hypothetical protein [Desulfobulbaceae bacterium]
MKHRHWHYFLSIEKEIINISEHIEIHSENFKTFSASLTKVYLSICSEIDVILKLLCQSSNAEKWTVVQNSFPRKEYPDIEVYKTFINHCYPDFKSIEINIPLYNIPITPWNNFAKQLNPEWWDKYNKVKHLRNEFYKNANLKNVLHSAAGLLVCLLFLYGLEKDLYMNETNKPKLFSIPNEFLANAIEWAPARVIIPE